MLPLFENEKILLVVRKHWFVMARTAILFFVLLFVPVIGSFLFPYMKTAIPENLLYAGVNFFVSLYFAAISAFLFFEWMDYYLDTWIITTRRIIDIEQQGLFSRHVAEIPLSRVQDITIEVNGILETLLRFGTIRIQTAGERDFFIHDVPRLQELKNTILSQLEARQTEGQKEGPAAREYPSP